MAVTITIPQELVDPIRVQLLSLYQSAGESVHHAGDRYLRERHRETLDELLEHRSELLALDRLLAQLGFELGVPAEPVELVGDGRALRSAVFGLLNAVAEHIGEASERCWRREAGLDQVSRSLDFARAQLRLLGSIDEQLRAGGELTAGG